jgi:hypothetical protein
MFVQTSEVISNAETRKKVYINIHVQKKNNLVLEVAQRHGDSDPGGGRMEHFFLVDLS